MEWLLIIVLMTAEDDVELEPMQFASKAECIAAAETFVEKHPAFELRYPPDEDVMAYPVLRSYVECVPDRPPPEMP